MGALYIFLLAEGFTALFFCQKKLSNTSFSCLSFPRASLLGGPFFVKKKKLCYIYNTLGNLLNILQKASSKSDER